MPDISHREQNVIMLRYVHKQDEEWEIRERFLIFKDFGKKTGKEIAEMLVSTLKGHDIDIAECRGQGYDNGFSMSGKARGAGTHIGTKSTSNFLSMCITPIYTYTLNLVGVHAAQSCPEIGVFFGFLNQLYTQCIEDKSIILSSAISINVEVSNIKAL